MATAPSNLFWAPKTFNAAQRIRCKLHEEWVSTEWTLKNPGTPSEAYEVICRPTKHKCKSHFGATETITIGRPAWNAAAPDVVWYCFDPENPQ